MQLTRKKPGETTGLDIESGSIAATEIRTNGSVQVTGSAIGPLPPGLVHEGEVVDGDGLATHLKALFTDHKLSKRVRLGVANQQVLVRTVRLPAIEDPKEMDAAIRFQAQEQIPMPLEQAALEHQIVGGVAAEDGAFPQVDVIVVAARRDMVISFLEPHRRAGLQPGGFVLSAFAMIRALADAYQPDRQGEPAVDATLYCGVGDIANLAIARGRSCLFTRASAAGLEPIVERLVATRGVTHEHAAQWLRHVGLRDPIEQVAGDPETVAEARGSLEEGVAALLDDLRRSLDFYGAQEGAAPIGRILLGGVGSSIPGLADRIMEQLGTDVQIARPHGLGGYDDPTAARLTLSYGLGLES
jgi:type IV pilus assembly protein PilM